MDIYSLKLSETITPYWTTIILGEGYPTVQAAFHLKLFDALVNGPKTANDISQELNINLSAIIVLFQHLSSLNLLNYLFDIDSYALTPISQNYLTQTSQNDDWQRLLSSELSHSVTPVDYLSQVQSKFYNSTEFPFDSLPNIEPLIKIFRDRLTFPCAYVAEKLNMFSFFNRVGTASINEIALHFDITEKHSEEILTSLTTTDILEEISFGRYSLKSAGREITLNLETNPYHWGGMIDLIGPGMITPLSLIKRIRDVSEKKTNDTKDANEMMKKVMLDETQARLFGAHMRSQMQHSGEFIASLPLWRGDEKVLDVGGGFGHYLIEFAKSIPKLTGTVLEIPYTDTLAKETIMNAGYSDRLGVITGNFWDSQVWPKPDQNYDTILLSYIIHDWKPNDIVKILKHCVNTISTVKDGKILVHDMFLDEKQSSSLVKTAFSRIVWYWTDEGRQYKLSELKLMATEAGLNIDRVENLNGPSNVVVLRL